MTSLPLRAACSLIGFVLITAVCSVRPARAQPPPTPAQQTPSPEPKPPSPWQVQMSLSAGGATGDSGAANLGVDSKVTRTTSMGILTIKSDVAVSYTGESQRGPGSIAPSATSADYAADARSQILFAPGSRFYWITHAGWSRNVDSGVFNRAVGSAGAGYILLKSSSQSLKIDVRGAAIWREILGPNERAAAVATSVDYRWSAKTTEFTSFVELEQNLSSAHDYQLRTKNSLTASISKSVSLQLSARAKYDDHPAPLLLVDGHTVSVAKGLNMQFRAGVQINF